MYLRIRNESSGTEATVSIFDKPHSMIESADKISLWNPSDGVWMVLPRRERGERYKFMVRRCSLITGTTPSVTYRIVTTDEGGSETHGFEINMEVRRW